MTEQTVSPPNLASSEAQRRPSVLGFGRWCGHALSSPLRFVFRSRRRAVVSLALLVLAALASSAAIKVWFTRHLSAARVEVERGHNAAAVQHLRQCQRVNPDDRDVLLLSARVARRSGAFEEAESLLNQSVELYGNEDGVVLERVLLKAAQGEMEAVGPQLLARLQTGGAEAELAREALVTGFLYRFRWPDAYQHLQHWLTQSPDSTFALLLMGKLEEQRQGVEAAIALYRRVLELDPEHHEARLRMLTQLVGNRRGDEALPHAEVLRKHLPDNAEVAILWVRVLALLGRTSESRAALDECLRTHPDFPAALIERGGQALVDGNEPEAEQYFARAVQLEPGNLVACERYAFALARNGKAKEANQVRARAERLKVDFERITVLISGPLQERPDDPNVHHEIAQIALRSGLIREALRWFQSALQVDPNHVPTHRALAILYRELNKPVLAARHRAFAQGAGDPSPKP